MKMTLRLLCLAALMASSPFSAHGASETTVRTVLPAAPGGEQGYEVPGRTEPYEASLIFTRATGIIAERRFDIGDVVKAGDTLAVVDAQEIAHAVEAARAALEQAKARAELSRSLAARASKLAGSQALAKEVSEQREATVVELEAAVRQAKAQLARLEAEHQFSTVKAPFDGVIAARNFDRGDHVRGDSSPPERWLYRLVRLDKLRFTVNASPDLALRLSNGMAATITFREFPGERFEAQVARSSHIFDTASGTMRVELLLENREMKLPAGLTGTAAFRLPPGRSTFRVPANTLLSRKGKNLLATVADGKVEFIEVLPGRHLGAEVEVTSAQLKSDTAVIINPNALLRAGDPVTVGLKK